MQTQQQTIATLAAHPAVASVKEWRYGRHYVNLRGADRSYRGDRSTKIYIDKAGDVYVQIGDGSVSAGLLDGLEAIGYDGPWHSTATAHKI